MSPGFDQARAAAEARQANAAVHTLFAKRGARDSATWKAWLDSTVRFRQALDNAYPPGFWANFEALKQGDPSSAKMVIRFLEEDPWFFGSGYAKADLIRYLVRLPLSANEITRLRRVVLDAIDLRDRREFRSYCRLAARVLEAGENDVELQERAASEDAGVRRRAQWVIEACRR